MITTSTAYNNAVVASTRETKAKIQFDILDVDAYLDATATVTSEAAWSKKAQMFNQVRALSGKYATFENDYWLLDGSFSLMPKSSESGYEVGWWSDALSGTGGTFSVAQVVTINFTVDQSSIGFTIAFDDLANEYAKDFTITVKNSSNATIHTATITNNTLSKYILVQNLLNYRKIEISITKWKSANRRARITEVDFGIVKEYTDVEIIGLNVLEEVDLLSNQISSNELKFILDNQDKSFNILNPTGIFPYLQRKQKIKAYLGTTLGGSVVEYIPMGQFYLSEWESDEGSLTASFTANDAIELMTQGIYAATTHTTKTLKFIVDDIMTKAGITDYTVDSALSSVTVTGTIPESDYRDALQIVALAGQAVVYCDRTGKIQIKQLSAGSSVATLDYDNVYSAPKIALNKLINTVEVKYGANTYTLTDPNKPVDEQVQTVKIENPLISTLAHATNVANWILNQVKKRFIYEVNWRQNQALELCDTVTVQDDYSEDKNMRITKQEFNYQGYLSGKTTGRGV